MELLSFEDFPALKDAFFVLAISASLAWAWTEWAKKTLQLAKVEKSEHGWMWQQGVRLLALALGCLAGWLVGSDSWDVVLGAVGAIHSALIVKILRKRLSDESDSE